MRNLARWSQVGAVWTMALVALIAGRSAPVLTQAPAAAQSAASAKSIAEGQAIFEDPKYMCVTCHRKDLGGLVGPNLTDDLWLHGCTSADLVKNVRTGFPDRGMVPFGGGPALTDPQLRSLSAYILSKRGSKPLNPKPIDAARDKACK